MRVRARVHVCVTEECPRHAPCSSTCCADTDRPLASLAVQAPGCYNGSSRGSSVTPAYTRMTAAAGGSSEKRYRCTP
eukprot:12889115-Alexandrium_andersonii.AAC.1